MIHGRGVHDLKVGGGEQNSITAGIEQSWGLQTTEDFSFAQGVRWVVVVGGELTVEIVDRNNIQEVEIEIFEEDERKVTMTEEGKVTSSNWDGSVELSRKTSVGTIER